MNSAYPKHSVMIARKKHQPCSAVSIKALHQRATEKMTEKMLGKVELSQQNTQKMKTNGKSPIRNMDYKNKRRKKRGLT